MLSAVNGFELQNHKLKQQAGTSIGFCSWRMDAALHFDTVKEGVLYRGGIIDTAEKMDYLVHEKGVRSVLNLLSGRHNATSTEFDLIDVFNKTNPGYNIKYSHLANAARSLVYDPKGLQVRFLDQIKGLPLIIYMHCHLGDDLSGKMKDLFNLSLREGKITFRQLP